MPQSTQGVTARVAGAQRLGGTLAPPGPPQAQSREARAARMSPQEAESALIRLTGKLGVQGLHARRARFLSRADLPLWGGEGLGFLEPWRTAAPTWGGRRAYGQLSTRGPLPPVSRAVAELPAPSRGTAAFLHPPPCPLVSLIWSN